MLRPFHSLRRFLPFLKKSPLAGGVTSLANGAGTMRPVRRTKVHGKVDLRSCAGEKKVFFEGIAQLIEAGRPEAEVYTRIEDYFHRLGDGGLVAEWEWEMIPASHPTDADESVRSIVRRSMIEASIRIVSVVLHGEMPGKQRLPLRAQLERAEWSLKRGGQTLFLTMDEAMAPYRPDEERAALPEETLAATA